ncbi:MAG TPA: acyltransferase domain-containing protein [Actinocrinis sp.]|nr:acyltransferase domain-containing protein [Actinocrinis sp.]
MIGRGVPTGMSTPRPVALLLPGQGAQHQGMGVGLYEREPAFTDAIDEFFVLLGREGAAIRADWLSDNPRVAVDEAIRAQPLLFGIGYAMGRMLQSWGVEPSVLLGHSAGEYVAAALAGVASLEDAAALLLSRVELFQDAPVGGMLAVVADEERVAPFLTDEVVVGAVNGPGQLLVAGPQPQLSEVRAALERAEITCMPAKALRGFHSPSILAACAASIPAFAGIRLNAPAIPIVSASRPGLLDKATARDPEFWAMVPGVPVLFGPALDLLLSQGSYLLVETGPGQGLSVLARRHPEVLARRSAVVSLLGHRPAPPHADRGAVLRAIDRLTTEGYRIAPSVRDCLVDEEPAAAVPAVLIPAGIAL